MKKLKTNVKTIAKETNTKFKLKNSLAYLPKSIILFFFYDIFFQFN